MEKMVPNYSRLVMKFKKDLLHDGLWENESWCKGRNYEKALNARAEFLMPMKDFLASDIHDQEAERSTVERL